MEPVRLLLGGGHRRRSNRSVWVFLARGSFAVKTPDHEGLISLDFLGFSRSNLDISMGYGGFLPEGFFSALFPGGFAAPGREPTVEAMRKGSIVHAGELNLVSDSPQ
jgi:hypothetical protein